MIDIPICLDPRGERRHRQCFDAANQPHFLTFNDDGSCSAEWVKNHCFIAQLEAGKVSSHKVGRERKNEPVPVMNRQVFGGNFIRICILDWDSKSEASA